MSIQPNEEQDLKAIITRAHIDYLDSLKASKRLPREFVGGIVRGLGMALGGTIVFAIALYLISQLLWPGAEQWIDERLGDFQTATALLQN